jgi:hypothetical protein
VDVDRPESREESWRLLRLRVGQVEVVAENVHDDRRGLAAMLGNAVAERNVKTSDCTPA